MGSVVPYKYDFQLYVDFSALIEEWCTFVSSFGLVRANAVKMWEFPKIGDPNIAP